MAMTLLVVVALSSYAQCLFGLDGKGGLSRYRLLPVQRLAASGGEGRGVSAGGGGADGAACAADRNRARD